MVMKQESRKTLAEALRHLRYEIFPLEGVEDTIVRYVPKDIKLTVTASPKRGIETTLDLAGRLAGRGYRAVPHLSARLVADWAHLASILERMHELELREAFVVAGDLDEPSGEFTDAYELLSAMAKIGHDLEEIGITGYPESHPIISDQDTIQAMYDKAPYATYIVSQICFDPGVIAGWIRRVRRRGVYLPIYIGFPGVIDRQKLLRISTRIGLGESARFLRKNKHWLLRLFAPGYKPDYLLEGLSPCFAVPALKIRGFHVYTFNEVEKTEAWRHETLDRLGGLPRSETRGAPR
jgi:methylenetetrahydrofolate reductase (NADPH)